MITIIQTVYLNDMEVREEIIFDSLEELILYQEHTNKELKQVEEKT